MTLWDLLQPCNIAPHSPHFKHINIIKDTIINNKHMFISYGTMLIHFRLKMYLVIWYPFRSLNGFNTFHLFLCEGEIFLEYEVPVKIWLSIKKHREFLEQSVSVVALCTAGGKSFMQHLPCHMPVNYIMWLLYTLTWANPNLYVCHVHCIFFQPLKQFYIQNIEFSKSPPKNWQVILAHLHWGFM